MRPSRLRPWFSVHRLIAVALAIFVIALGIMIEWNGRFQRIADRHRGEVPKHFPRVKPVGMEDKHWHLIDWHASMVRKYDHAARYPWLPVEPDPPEPE
jgi:hypothetical protein